MKRLLSIILLQALFLSTAYVFAADKVVVIPMDASGAGGTNKQMQYNDNGRMAGARMYYDKVNQRVGVSTGAPDFLFHVKASKSDYLVGVHNTSTHSSGKGMVVRADGGDPFVVQTSGGTNAFGVSQFGSTFVFGHLINSGTLFNTGSGTFGGAPLTFDLNVSGTAGKTGGGTWSSFSDKRIKKNIGKLENALDKISQLRGVSFEWIHPDEHSGKKGVQAGFLAQDLEKVFPDWVSEVEPVGKDKELIGEREKVKALFFPHDFNAYLVEAIKALRAENEALKALVCIDHPDATLCQ